ncbi:uncharacterized protein LOC113566655 [Drosophila persimilis]|uniref:uncharacterized protein LOC113566655 n=1 Tax=Drosophila persimilis TaxID=7234 RepID=UPI000F07D7C9|nr:uncharacterized protein LOC113566655 [Drosophila persimilis]
MHRQRAALPDWRRMVLGSLWRTLVWGSCGPGLPDLQSRRQLSSMERLDFQPSGRLLVAGDEPCSHLPVSEDASPDLPGLIAVPPLRRADSGASESTKMLQVKIATASQKATGNRNMLKT